MKVVLDANILVSDPWLAGPDFRVLLTSLGETGHSLAVPALALDEAVNKYGENLTAAHRRLSQASAEYRRLVREPSVTPEPLDCEGRVAKYRAFLREQLRQAGATVLPYPKVSHQHLVRRALERRRPFNEKGAGYRDALIWHSVLAQARTPGPVAFVSNDSGDFFLNGKEPHPDLVQDARGLRSVHFFRCLREFVDREVKPKLSDADAVRDALNRSGRYKDLDVRRLVTEHLVPQVQYLHPETLGAVADVGFPHVVAVEEVANVNVTGVHRVRHHEYVIDLVTDCEVRYETYIGEDFDEHPEEVDLPNPSADELMDEAYPRALLRVSASITVDPEGGAVTAVEVRSVDPAV